MRSTTPATATAFPRLHVAWAALCIGLVLTLNFLAVSPLAHEQVCHHESSGQSDEGCAVLLFAQGVDAALAPASFSLVEFVCEERLLPAVERLPAQPSQLLPPGRGPPLA